MTRVSGQPASTPASSAGSAGSVSARVSVTPGAATASVGRPAGHGGAADRLARARRARRRTGSCPRPRPCGRRCASGSARPTLGDLLLQAAVGQRGVHRAVGRCRRASASGAGRVVGQRHRGQRVPAAVRSSGPGNAGPVAGAEGGPAVEHAGGRAGGAHRQRADRRSARPAPTAPASRSGSTSLQARPGHADDDHAVGGAPSGRGGRAAGGTPSSAGEQDDEHGRGAAPAVSWRARRPAGRAARGRRRPAAGRRPPRRASRPPARGRRRPARAACAGSPSTADDGVGERRGVADRHQLGAGRRRARACPPARVETSGVPARSASWAVNGLPSHREGSTQSVGGAEQVGDVGRAGPSSRTGSRSAPDPLGQLVLQRPVAGDRDQRCRLQPSVALPAARPRRAGRRSPSAGAAGRPRRPAAGRRRRPSSRAHLGARAASAGGSGGASAGATRTSRAPSRRALSARSLETASTRSAAADGHALDRAQQPLPRARALLQGVVQGEHQRPVPLPRQPPGGRGDQAGAQAVGVHQVGAGGGPAQLADRAARRRPGASPAEMPTGRKSAPAAVKPNSSSVAGAPQTRTAAPAARDARARSVRTWRADPAGAGGQHLDDPAAAQGRRLGHRAPPVVPARWSSGARSACTAAGQRRRAPCPS